MGLLMYSAKEHNCGKVLYKTLIIITFPMLLRVSAFLPA